MIQAFTIDPASTNTTVKLTDTSAALDSWSADLSTYAPTLMPAHQPSNHDGLVNYLGAGARESSNR